MTSTPPACHDFRFRDNIRDAADSVQRNFPEGFGRFARLETSRAFSIIRGRRFSKRRTSLAWVWNEDTFARRMSEQPTHWLAVRRPAADAALSAQGTVDLTRAPQRSQRKPSLLCVLCVLSGDIFHLPTAGLQLLQPYLPKGQFKRFAAHGPAKAGHYELSRTRRTRELANPRTTEPPNPQCSGLCSSSAAPSRVRRPPIPSPSPKSTDRGRTEIRRRKTAGISAIGC